MKTLLWVGLLLGLTSTSFAQILSREELEESYFYVADSMLHQLPQYDLREFRASMDGQIHERAYPELDHWALLISKYPEYALEIRLHAPTDLSDPQAKQLTDGLAQSIRQYLSRWGLQNDQLLFASLGKQEPLVPVREIRTMPADAQKTAHELNFRAGVRVLYRDMN